MPGNGSIGSRPADISPGVQRIKPEGVAIVGDGPAVAPVSLVEITAPQVRLCTIWILAKQLRVIGKCCFQTALANVHLGALLKGQATRGIQFKRASEIGKSSVPFATLPVRGAALNMSHCVSGFQAQAF